MKILLYANAIIYFFIFKKIIKQKHLDLIIFSIMNFIIFNIGIHLRYKSRIFYIIEGPVVASSYYLFFMIFSALVLLVRTKNKTSRESLIRILLIFLSTFIVYVFKAFVIFMMLTRLIYFVAPG